MFEFALLARNATMYNGPKSDLARAYFYMAEGFKSKSFIDSALHYNNLAYQIDKKQNSSKELVLDMNQKGMILMTSGRYEDSYEAFADALDILRRDDGKTIDESRQKSMISSLFNNFGILFIRQSKFREADSLFENLLDSEDNLPDYSRMCVLGNLGTIYFNEGDFDRALEKQRQALELSYRLNDLESTGIGLQQIGNTFYHKGLYDSTLSYYMAALECQNKLGDKTILSQLLNNIASVYTKLGKPTLANNFFLESAKIKQELGDKNGLATTYGNIGLNYLNFENYQKAGYYFKQAQQISQETGSLSGMAYAFSRLGNMYNQMEKFDSARIYIIRSIELFTQLEDPYRVMIAKVALAESEGGSGNYAESLKLGREAIQIAANLDALFWEAKADIVTAEALMNLDKFAEADEFLSKALQYGEKNRNYEILSAAYDALWKLNKAGGRYDLALNYNQKMSEIRDSTFTAQKHQQIAELETIYETQKKEKENLALKTENEIQSLKLRNKNIVIWSMTLGILLTVISLFFLVHLYRKRTIAYRNLVAKNLELAGYDAELLQKGYGIPESVKQNMKESGNEDFFKEMGLFERFNKYFTEEKPYLYSNITIEEISAALSTNRTYLSRAINTVYQKSFITLVNEMRVRTARQMLSDKKLNHISLEGIGEMAGYNSRSVFYKNFKKLTGLTPSYFRDSVKDLT